MNRPISLTVLLWVIPFMLLTLRTAAMPMAESSCGQSKELLLKRPNGRVRAGVIHVPNGEGPFPAAVFLPGSGKHTREVKIGEYPWGSKLATTLCSNGIALISLDDPGAGASSGDKLQLEIRELIDDVRSAVQALKAYAIIDTKRIGLIGHSEGGVFACLAGKQVADVEFLVLMAAPARPIGVIIPGQFEASALELGLTAQAAAAVRSDLIIVFSRLSAEQNEARRRIIMEQFQQYELSRNAYVNWSEYWLKGLDESWMNRFASPWFHSHLQLNQASLDYSIRSIPQRVLVLQGSSDVQVSPKKDFNRLIKLMKESSVKHSGILFNGLDHLFGVNSARTADGYGKDMSVFESKVLPAIAGWINILQPTGGGKP